MLIFATIMLNFSNSTAEQYFGRTVTITEDTYTKSIYYWPYELDAQSVSYDFCEVVELDRDDAWISRNGALCWLTGDYLERENIRLLRFYGEDKEYSKWHCAISDDNEHLIVGWFIIERDVEVAATLLNQLLFYDASMQPVYTEKRLTGMPVSLSICPIGANNSYSVVKLSK